MDAVDKLIVAVDGEHDHLGLNLRGTVQKLDGHISIAIMHAMEAGPQVEEKVSATESLYTGWPDLLAIERPDVHSLRSGLLRILSL